MNTDTPRTNEALTAILERDFELSEKNAPEVLVKLCRAMECKAEELNHQLARSQEAGTIWYRRCFSEDAEWNLGELTKLTDERDELRDMLQEEQRLHLQTLNERDEARQWESQALVARIQRDQFSKTLGEVREILCNALPNENQLTSFMAVKLVKERDEARVLADRLAEALNAILNDDPDSPLYKIKEARAALAAWKEARCES
jgi:hypothetical protein